MSVVPMWEGIVSGLDHPEIMSLIFNFTFSNYPPLKTSLQMPYKPGTVATD